jgi:probable HAF family extracellular repeat protein
MIIQLRGTFNQIAFVVPRRSGALRIDLLALLVGAGVLYTLPVAAQATFTPLGLFGGVRSSASDMSADGSVIVGTSIGPGATVSVFRLTPQGSSVRPTGLIGSQFTGTEVSVSADGSTVVGTYLSSQGQEAFRWVGDGPFEPLGDLAGGAFQSNAFDVSADGGVVVGTSESDSGTTAFRWTAGGGMLDLGADERSARAVSTDGSVVVGNLWVEDMLGPAYRWTSDTGSIVLPILPRPRPAGAEARAVTPDGSVVVGYNSFHVGLSQDDFAAFRWTEQEGTIDLEAQGWDFTVPFDISADGSVVVGSGSDPATTSGAAFIWTTETGMLSLRDVLIFGGVTNLNGWRLVSAEGVSEDGLTVVGTALHEQDGRREAYVATIGAIPEPSTFILTALSAASLLAAHVGKWRRTRPLIDAGGWLQRSPNSSDRRANQPLGASPRLS